MPVLVARQNVDIQRRFALLARLFDARGQVHLQRMVIQHHFLGVGDQRRKAQIVAKWVALSQLTQAFRAAVVEVFQSGEQ